jgi:hypothetical protein
MRKQKNNKNKREHLCLPHCCLRRFDGLSRTIPLSELTDVFRLLRPFDPLFSCATSTSLSSSANDSPSSCKRLNLSSVISSGPCICSDQYAICSKRHVSVLAGGMNGMNSWPSLPPGLSRAGDIAGKVILASEVEEPPRISFIGVYPCDSLDLGHE